MTSVPQLLFSLQRCLADPRAGVVHDLQVFHGQFAAHDDGRPLDQDPALVRFRLFEDALVLLGSDLFMDDRVKHAYDFAVDE